jgi:type IV pilus assembly protein PilO
MNLSELNNLDLKNFARATAPVKAVVLGVAFLLLVAAGYYLDWSPSLQELDQARAEEMKLRDVYTEKKRQAIHLEAYRKRLADTEKALAAMLRQLPNRAEMDALLTDINQTGISQGLEFDLFKPGNEVKADFYATMPVTIKVNGGFHELASFASNVAKLPRIVTVHNITLAPRKDGMLNMDATIRTYRYLDPSEMPKPKPKAGKKGGKKK